MAAAERPPWLWRSNRVTMNATTGEISTESPKAGEASAAPEFLDVATLLERSQPVGRAPWIWIGIALLTGTMLASGYGSAHAGRPQQQLLSTMASAAMLALMAGMAVFSWNTVRSHREEQRRIEAVEELVQLRRWPQAAGMLGLMLSAPMRTQQTRVQALLYLTSVLARYHRFGDAIAVEEYLLDNLQLDERTEYALLLARAMGLLHEDRLFDADRAISDLRRGSVEGRESAGLALIEIYRDVKTGHPAEAIAMFEQKRTILRQQLAHRLADAYGLAARAYDMQGFDDQACSNWRRATLLCPAGELRRRYAEVIPLIAKYQPAETPAEAR